MITGKNYGLYSHFFSGKNTMTDTITLKKFSADKPWVVLSLLTITGMLLRSIGLGVSDLWEDEILFVNFSSLIHPDTGLCSPMDVIQFHWDRFTTIGHFPFPSVIQNMFLHIFTLGMAPQELLLNPLYQRIPSVLWGAACIPAAWVVSRQLYRGWARYLPVILITFSFFPVYYSREAYVYAPLMCLTLLATGQFLSIISQKQLTWKSALLLVLFSTLNTFCHMNGALYSGILLFISLGVWIFWGKAGASRQTRIGLITCSVAPLLMVMPFFNQLLNHTSHHQWGFLPDIWTIPFTTLAKAFLGSHTGPTLIATFFFVSGIFGLVKSTEFKLERCVFISLVICMFFATFLAVANTQYAARYFSCVIILSYFVFGEGFVQLGRWVCILAPRLKTPLTVSAATTVYCCIHLAFFLPMMYTLPAKSTNYGGIARWLNSNLNPGTPYLLESSFTQRFIGGYHQTPGLLTATPYSHGPGIDESKRLRQIHQDFLLRFPESVFVETHRHGTEAYGEVSKTLGPWEWPHINLKQHVEIRNDNLENMMKSGIWPVMKGSNENEYSSHIYYNTRDDWKEFKMKQGEVAYLDFPSTAIYQIGNGLYARVTNQRRASILAENLVGAPVSAVFEISGALLGQQGAYDVEITYNGVPVFSEKRSAQQPWVLQTQPILLQPGEQVLEYGVNGDPAGLQAIAIFGARAIPATSSTGDTPTP
jgi:hypothetical protein